MSERLLIDRIGHLGDGIADTPHGPVYVRYALPGETVSVDPWPGHPDRRHLVGVVEKSPERIEPICPHFGVCGGCSMQHWREARYREWKRELVVAAFSHLGIAAEVGDLIDAHGAGRRRATFHARKQGHQILNVGFAGAAAHHIVPIDHCPILAPAMSGALPAAWAIAQVMTPLNKPLDIQVTATEGGLDVDVRGSGPITSPISASLAGSAEQHRLARITRHGELVNRRAAPTVRIGRASVELPPGGFLQATEEGEAVLARLVIEHLDGVKSAADLFCGVGPFALRIAEFARVSAADSDEGAVAALIKASGASGLKPIAAKRRDLFRQPLAAVELAADAVVFDPPRQGAEAQAREIARSKARIVVAVSCNPNTLARDAKILIDGGYRIGAVTPVDQFRYSGHVEVVAKFTR
jgi:23S rRNA (uracil1939-C5)-methyltransferase